MLPTSITLDPHKLFLAAAVVQATFTLTLALLAWADRRTYGMQWLAASAGLEFFSTAFRLMRGFHDPKNWDIPGGALLLATLLLQYRGLRWFTVRRELGSQRWPIALGAFTLFSLTLGLYMPMVGLLLLRVATLTVLAVTFNMLWDTRIASLRAMARVSALLCGALMVVLVSRLLMVVQVKGLDHVQIGLMSRESTLLILTLLEFSFVALFVAESNRRLHEETRVDALTGLRNRRSIEETAMHAVTRANGGAKPLSLLMLDLDRFKALNDTYGHALGDRALRAVGGVLLHAVTNPECVARLGGEEFAVLVPGSGMEAAAALGEQLRATVENLRLGSQDDAASLTVSIGVSSMRPGEQGWEPMLHRADVALYRAKTAGRNRVTLCDADGVALQAAALAQKGWWARLLSGRGPLL